MIKWLKKKYRRQYREWQIARSYAQPFPSGASISSKPAIIHIVSNKLQQGGLLDRIKGMVSSYQLAQLLGYEFYLHIDTQHFDLYQFLRPVQPAMVNPEAQIVWNARYAKPVFLMDHRPNSLAELTAIFKGKHRQYHVYCNQDYTDLIHPNLSASDKKQYWSAVFHQMFRFSDALMEKANRLLPSSGQQVVGIHGRFMNLLGDFTDTVNGSLDKQAALELVEECLNYVKQVFARHPESFFVVVSDSGVFLQKVKQAAAQLGMEDRMQIDAGHIAHIDFNRASEVLEKTVFDFYLLTRCSTVYQLVAPKMYLSQYARYATYISNANLVRLP